MNVIAKHLTQITMVVATLAAGVVAQPSYAADATAVRVIQLQPVVVTAKRIRVVQLERVVVTAKRVAPQATVVAERNGRGAPAQPTGRV